MSDSSKSFKVVAPLAVGQTETGGDLYLYRSPVVHTGQSDEWIDAHLATGHIELVDESDDCDESDEVERPAGNASLDAWVAFAVASGVPEADLVGLSRDEVRDLFE